MLTAALLIASALLLNSTVAPRVGGVSLLGAGGYGVSLLLGWRLLEAIRASGDIRSND